MDRRFHLFRRLTQRAIGVGSLLFILGSSAWAVEFTTSTTISSGDYAGEAIIVTGCTLTIDCSGGQGSYASLLVRSNGVVTHPAGSENGLWLQFTGNVDVEAGSRVDADGKGYPANSGPGAGGAGSGGSYGGTGGFGGGAVYGSITAPTQLGSGGGDGDGGGGLPGGGAIRVEAGGTVTIDGSVQANGLVEPNHAGGSRRSTTRYRSPALSPPRAALVALPMRPKTAERARSTRRAPATPTALWCTTTGAYRAGPCSPRWT